MTDEIKSKIASFTNVKRECVFSAHDLENILLVPSLLESQGMAERVMQRLGLFQKTERSLQWDSLIDVLKAIDEENKVVKIAIVGKYTGLLDSYLSVIKALEHGAINSKRKLEILWVESSDLNDDNHENWKFIKEADGILVPGGFGQRGTLGKIKAIKYARENRVPYLGVCLGMQLAVIEF